MDLDTEKKTREKKDGPAHPDGRNIVIKRHDDWAKIFRMCDVSLIIYTQVWPRDCARRHQEKFLCIRKMAIGRVGIRRHVVNINLFEY